MNENPMNPQVEDEENDSPIIGMSRLSYNKETGEVKRDLFWTRMNAEGGDVDAMCSLGSAYLFGTDLDRDPEKAAYWFAKAADEGESVAMFNLGLMYAKGFGVERSFEKAAEWMGKAQEAGDEDAESLAEQFGANAETMRKAEVGDTREQAMLGVLFQNMAEGNMLKEAGPEQDYSDSLYWSWKAAKAGEPIAMNNLGVLYSKGQGTAKNYEEAFRWYHEAADRGLDIAMSNVAYYYVFGKGVEIDFDLSAEWFEKAIQAGWTDQNHDLPRVAKLAAQMKSAKAGNVEAQANIADELRGIGLSAEQNGDDPQKAYTESLIWAQRAAEADNPKGMRILALAYLFGRGVEKDPENGLALLNKGVNMNDTDCMVTLAQVYLNGDGVERNLDRARDLLARAKDLGSKDAEDLLGKLSGETLNPEEQLNLAVKAAVVSLASGKTPTEVAEDIGLDEGLVTLVNVIRLLRGLKRPDENVDDVLDMPTKMIFTLTLNKLRGGQTPQQIASELPVPENMISVIDQIDAIFRK